MGCISAHDVILFGQARSHTTNKLWVPSNHAAAATTKIRELNHVENIWQYLRENWTVNPGSRHRVKPSTHAAKTLVKLTLAPRTIMPISIWDSNHGFWAMKLNII
jgi:hypothetical protein